MCHVDGVFLYSKSGIGEETSTTIPFGSLSNNRIHLSVLLSIAFILIQ